MKSVQTNFPSDEIWVDIPQYEGIYQASNLGRIRTVAGKTTHTQYHGARHWKQRILKQKQDNKAFCRVDLWKDGKPKSYLVARLVCSAFHGDQLQNRYMTVNHKDGNRHNNGANNLEWLSRADNIRHGFRTGLYNTVKPVLLVDKSDSLTFASMSQCDRYLGRAGGYTSRRLKTDGTVTSANGRVFEVMLDAD